MNDKMEEVIRGLIVKYGIEEVDKVYEQEKERLYNFVIKKYNLVKVVTNDKPLAVEENIVVTNDKPLAVEGNVVVTNDKPLAVEGNVVVTNDKPLVVEKTEKEKHREAVEEKRQELRSKGIDPESLLTKENLDKWLKEGYSYSKIARETGCPDAIVSSKAKSYGYQSKVGLYIMNKKKLNK